jgi:Zn-dependent peptidase ImmA (M78 family)
MMTTAQLAERSLRSSIYVRKSTGIPLDTPVNPIDLALNLGVAVRYVDVSMEGMYVGGLRPAIVLSSLRPIGRRAFTCAHELAHHHYGDGSTIDELKEATSSGKFSPSEFLADTFAAFLLLPPPGLRKAFARRGLEPSNATPLSTVSIAHEFGVGFETLLTQMSSQRMLSAERVADLERAGIQAARRAVLGTRDSGPFAIIDRHCLAATVDLEVGTVISLPSDVQVQSRLLRLGEGPEGILYRACSAGIERIVAAERDWSAFVRISRRGYVGLAAYRHLEDDDE